ncbi:ribokinase [Actinocatenispora rupis]|uniref:Ribokinase n=1 Tax=Actinocatenispora rupis TaxID=519421 RepID=A0A8J3JD03_9ACTN|nr:ribokinase [Actinocatenispora rupis]GID14469.1 ribokinase [Actinocatenispora rupis]
MQRESLTVVGSLNLDLTCRTERLPAPGETVTAHHLDRVPGGKGANQAVAAARLGAAVRMVGAVGDDDAGPVLRAALRTAGVDDSGVVTVDGPSGTALIAVDDRGENQIIVVPGANALVRVDAGVADAPAVLCQLEIPLPTVLAAARTSRGFFALNAAPAVPLPDELRARCDLVIVNETEYAALGGLPDARLVAVTYGSRGAELRARGELVATAEAPAVRAVDSVGAGDAFCAALVLALRSGLDPGAALTAACRVGAYAVTVPGARPDLPPLADFLTGAVDPA